MFFSGPRLSYPFTSAPYPWVIPQTTLGRIDLSRDTAIYVIHVRHYAGVSDYMRFELHKPDRSGAQAFAAAWNSNRYLEPEKIHRKFTTVYLLPDAHGNHNYLMGVYEDNSVELVERDHNAFILKAADSIANLSKNIDLKTQMLIDKQRNIHCRLPLQDPRRRSSLGDSGNPLVKIIIVPGQHPGAVYPTVSPEAQFYGPKLEFQSVGGARPGSRRVSFADDFMAPALPPRPSRSSSREDLPPLPPKPPGRKSVS